MERVAKVIRLFRLDVPNQARAYLNQVSVRGEPLRHIELKDGRLVDIDKASDDLVVEFAKLVKEMAGRKK